MLILSIMISLVVMGQIKLHSDVEAYSFEGIKSFDGKLFYSIHYGAPLKDIPYNYVIQLYDQTLNRIASDLIPVKYLGYIQAVIAHKEGIMVYVKSGKEGTLIQYDANGKRVFEKNFLMEKGEYNEVGLASNGESGFAIVRPDKEKKDGFRATMYNAAGEETWTQAFYPEKGNIDWKSVQLAGDFLMVHTQFTKSAFSTVYEDKFYLFNSKDGSILAQPVVTSDVEGIMLKKVLLNSDGSTFAIGITSGKNKQQKVETTGLGYRAFDAAGAVLFEGKLNYSDLMARGFVSDLALQQTTIVPALKFHEVKAKEYGYEIVTEQYSWDQLPAPAAQPGAPAPLASPGFLYVLDYAVFNIGKDGSLLDLKMIGKPHKVIKLESFNVSEGIKADDFFTSLNLFAYSHRPLGSNDIVELNWSNNVPYIGFNPVVEGHENILNRIFISKRVTEQPFRTDMSTLSLKKEGLVIPKTTLAYGLVPFNENGKALYYELISGKGLLLRVVDLKAELPEVIDNKVIVSGIGVQDVIALTPIENQGSFILQKAEQAENGITLYIYHQFDLNMKTINRTVLKVPNGARYVSDLMLNDGHLLAFKDPIKHTWSFSWLDMNGKLLDQNNQPDEPGKDIYETGYVVLGKTADGFYATTPIYNSDKNSHGYRISRFNHLRKLAWTGNYMPEANESIELIGSDAGNGIFALLHSQHPKSFYNKIINKVVLINDKTGAVINQVDLFDGEDTPFPQAIKMAGNDIICSGMFFKGTTYDKKNSDGFFYLRLSPSGEKLAYHKSFWKEAEDYLKVASGSDFLVSGNVQVFIQDMLVDEAGNCKLIGELFKKSAGTTGLGYLMGNDLGDRAFSVYDFIIFDYQANKLNSVYRIPKAEQNVLIEGSTGYLQGLSLSFLMKQYRVFSYLKTLKAGGESRLVYKNVVDNQEYLFTSPVQPGAATPIKANILPPVIKEPEPDMPEAIDKLNARLEEFNQKMQTVGNKLQFAMTGTTQTLSFSFDPSKGYMVAEPSSVYVYYFNPFTGKLNIEKRLLN